MVRLEELEKRITKTAGIAYIRDTQITVWSVIKDSMNGMSDEEIVLKYSPRLTHDEILLRCHSGFTLDDFEASFFYYSQNRPEFYKRGAQKEIEIDW